VNGALGSERLAQFRRQRRIANSQAHNKTAVGKQKNRRIEFKLLQ
jgi:hypothetical protein